MKDLKPTEVFDYNEIMALNKTINGREQEYEYDKLIRSLRLIGACLDFQNADEDIQLLYDGLLNKALELTADQWDQMRAYLPFRTPFGYFLDQMEPVS
jgi:hypothetical protein